MRVEGEVFREPKPEIGRNRHFLGLAVSFFGSLHPGRAESAGCSQDVPDASLRWKVRIFGSLPQCRETGGIRRGLRGKGEAFRGRFSADFMPKVSKFGRKLVFTALQTPKLQGGEWRFSRTRSGLGEIIRERFPGKLAPGRILHHHLR